MSQGFISQRFLPSASLSLPSFLVARTPPAPARIALINIMDNAKGTEDHFKNLIHTADPHATITLCRMTCAQADVNLATPKYFRDKNHPLYLMSDHYVDWHEVLGKQDFDLVIVTGINRGKLTYPELEEQYPLFWQETQELLDVIDTTIKTGQTGHSLLVCWSAFAAMKHWSDVDKSIYDQKFYGVFDHEITAPDNPLVRGIKDLSPLNIPHSRYSYMDAEELGSAIAKDNGEVVLNCMDGPAIWTLHNRAITCVINHPEYGHSTLHNEHLRDQNLHRETTGNPDIHILAPQNYELGSAQTAKDFATLKSLICPTFYKNLIDLAKSRKITPQPLLGSEMEADTSTWPQTLLA